MPRRRCVGCGRIAAKTELIRIAVEQVESPARAVVDSDCSRPGRGAYLCRAAEGGAEEGDRPAGACLQRALRREAIQRTLHARVALDPKLVESVSR